MGRLLRGIFAAAALGVALAACGGKASDPGLVSGSQSAAGIAPAGAIAFFAVDTDLGSQQWQQAGTLLSRFPDRAKLLMQLTHSWQSDTGTSFQSDVRPALGPQLDGVAFSKTGTSGSDFVLLMQPKDTAAFKRLVTKLDAGSGPSAVADYRGWKVIGETQASIAEFEADAKAGPALADDPTFKDATGTLSGNALAVAYANGSKLTSALTSALPQVSTTGTSGRLQWAVADLAANGDGVQLDAVVRTTGLKSAPSPINAKLLDSIPADALGVLWFDGDTFRRESAQLPGALRQGLGSSGSIVPGLNGLVPTFEKLGAAFQHENALYVRRGTGPIPEVTLITTPDDPAAVETAVAKTLRSLLGPKLTPQPITIGSVQAETIDLGRVSIYYGEDQGRFVVTTSQQAFADLRSGGPKLSGDPTFKEAKSASSMPDATDGFLYVNLTDSIQTIESFAQAAGTRIPPEVESNLKPLHTALVWATNDGTAGKAGVFVGIN